MAYIDDYKLLRIAILVVIPSLIVFQRVSAIRGSGYVGGVEL
jgi:hypothetical protein